MADLLNNILNQSTQSKPYQPLPALKLDLSTQNKIQPLNPRGRVLKSHIFGSPIEYAKDLKKDVIGITKGVKGKANDHELGKMNDLAMKFGSLGLATYLFAKNPLKLKRTMEFVGFGTFFASMALWPKLAIQAPLKARTGVDIHQKYEDSYGRKKMFFQDPQYVPWDLVSKEDLSKMGDRLGVPKDIKNRDEVIKLQAQKIAVQGNTLWMLTAGLATPVASALACNKLEGIILPKQEQSAIGKTEKKVARLMTVLKDEKLNEAQKTAKLNEIAKGSETNYAKKVLDKVTKRDHKKALATFIENNKSQPLTEEKVKELVELLSAHNNGNLADAIQEDFIAQIKPVTRQIDDSFAQKFFDATPANIKEFGISVEDIKAGLEVAGKTKGSTIDPKELSVVSSKLIKNLVATEKIKGSQARNLQNIFQDSLTTALDKHSLPTVGDLGDKAKTMFAMLDDFMAQKNVVDKYIDARVGDKAETYIANQWGRVNKVLLDVLDFNEKELALVGMGGSAKNKEGASIVESKLKALASNPDKFKAAMEKLTSAIAEYDKTISAKFLDTSKEATEKVIRHNAEKFAANGYDSIVHQLLGSKPGGDVAGALKTTVKNNVENRINGARYSFYRMIQTLDLYKKMDDVSKIDIFAKGFPESIRKFGLDKVAKVFKDESVNLGEGGYNQLQDALQNAYGKTIKNGELWGKFAASLEGVTPEKAQAIKNAVESNIHSLAGKEKLAEALKGILNAEADEVSQNILKTAGDFAEEKSYWKKIGTIMQTTLQEYKSTNTHEVSTVLEKAKQVLVNYHITDHAEKFNDIGSDTYKKVINLIFNNGFSSDTNSILTAKTNLVSGLETYRKEFVKEVANWQAWVKPESVLDSGSVANDGGYVVKGLKRHILVGAGFKDAVSEIADNAYNTLKWKQMFGKFGVGLLGVTLISGLFFGKMKKEDVYGGGNK